MLDPKRPLSLGAIKHIESHADLAMQIFCSQIAGDYLKFIKTHVIKDVPGCKDINIRELMVLLLIDATAHKMMKSHEVARVLRVDASTISRGVYALVAKGYLIADDDIYDNRSRVFTLTEQSNLFLKDYRARCKEAIQEANERLGVTVEEYNETIQAGYEALYRIKDRAAAFKSVKFKARQRFRPGGGRARPAQTPSDDHLYMFADYIFRIFADQISTDYLSFIKKHIVKDMNEIQKLSLREIRILMAIDFYAKPVVASEVGAVMRIDPATMSRGISVLMDLGLIKSSENHYDGRSKLLSMSESGLVYANTYKTISQEKITAAENHLGFHWDDDMRSASLGALSKVKARSMLLADLKRRKKRLPKAPKPEAAENIAAKNMSKGNFETLFGDDVITAMYQKVQK